MNCFEKNILLEEFHLQKKNIYIVKITVSLTRLKTTKPKLLQSCYDLNPLLPTTEANLLTEKSQLGTKKYAMNSKFLTQTQKQISSSGHHFDLGNGNK